MIKEENTMRKEASLSIVEDVKNHKFLMIRHHRGINNGCINFPGGKKEPDETMVYTFGVGRMVPLPTDKKQVRKGIEDGIKYIKALDGFLGINPVGWDRNLLIFDTLNNAKGSRNLLKAKDVACGEIIPVLIKTKYLEDKKCES